MPESRSRKKDVYTPPPSRGERKVARLGSPRWVPVLMSALFIIGLLWIVVFYIAGSDIPVMKNISAFVNVLIGFVFIGAGFIVSTRWR